MNVICDGLAVRLPATPSARPPAVANIHLTFQAGEQVALIGPSGAGKTTLLQALACARPPSAGQLLLEGENPWSGGQQTLKAARQRIFLAPQTPPLPPRQRVVVSMMAARLPNMGWWRSMLHLIRPGDLPEIHEALGQFDLQDKLFERVDRLSGGERQRVGLAKALLSQARLWLIDEPLSALDPARATQALSALQAHARARSVTLVVSLHQVEAARLHFPRIIGLRDGVCVFDLPSHAVTTDLLQQLYRSEGGDPSQAQTRSDDAPPATPPAPALMCR